MGFFYVYHSLETVHNFVDILHFKGH